MLTPPIEPILAEPWRDLPPEGTLPGGLSMEQKVDGYRAIVVTRAGRVLVQSRHGADLTRAFPDIAAAAAAVGEDFVLDGELVVPAQGRLDFAALQQRARRRGRTAIQAAEQNPAYLITFDVLEASGTELLHRPYRERRARRSSAASPARCRRRPRCCSAATTQAETCGWLPGPRR